jgi:uncharacterized protein
MEPPKPALSNKLKSLGVKTAADLPAPIKKPQTGVAIEMVLAGRWTETRRGLTFINESRYPLEYRHGLTPLFTDAPLHNLGQWAADPQIGALPLDKFAFLDTETSGLSGGTGTYAFLVGAGRFVDGEFRLAQFFMRDPAEEPALLEALTDFLAPCAALVTFNGKAYDAPLLATRYRLNSLPIPFNGFAHVDLLPLARRLWRDRLPSRALKYLEEHIMAAPRTIEEVPGYEIPYIYFDFLRTGEAAPLKGIFYHNAMDVIAMTALFSHTAALLADPHHAELEHGLDIIALAKLFEDLGKWEEAARLYERGLEMGISTGSTDPASTAATTALPEAGFWEATRRLSILQRRRGDVEAAIRLWEKAAGEGHIYAHVELSKHYEHRQRDYREALRWAKSALELANAPTLPVYIRQHWKNEISKRIDRLEEKSARVK